MRYPHRSDTGGWALDLVQLWNHCVKDGAIDNIEDYIVKNLGRQDAKQFGRGDLLADIDAYLMADMTGSANRTAVDAIRELRMLSVNERRERFLTRRFNNDQTTAWNAVRVLWSTGEAWITVPIWAFLNVARPTFEQTDRIATGFVNAIWRDF